MLKSIANTFTPSTVPSAILVVGNIGVTIDVLHFLPEDGTIERFGLTNSFAPPSATMEPTGDRASGSAQSHFPLEIDEPVVSFLSDVETRIHRLQTYRDRRVEMTQLVQEILKPAALEAIHEREGRDGSTDAMETYPVYLVYIRRSWASRALEDLTSFP